MSEKSSAKADFRGENQKYMSDNGTPLIVAFYILAYHDPECWTSCGKKSGPCFRFCEKFVGKRGYCCRQGQEWKEGGCDGIVGGVNRHECSYVAAG